MDACSRPSRFVRRAFRRGLECHLFFRDLMLEFGGPTPLGQLHALMDVVKQIVETEGFQGCIFVNAAIEFPLPHEPAHIAAAESKQAIEDLVCEVATKAGALNPRTLAKELSLIMEGAYVTRHVSGDQQAVEIARRLAKLAIADACPQQLQTQPHVSPE